MAKVQRFFTASTRDVANDCIKNGLLQYPGVCYVKDSQSLLWITEDNVIDEIIGNKQIVDIRFEDGYIVFYGVNDTILYSVEMKIDDEVVENVKDQIIEAVDLDSYMKTDDIIRFVTNLVGDLGESTSVVDYIDKITKQEIESKPIITLVGTLTNPIKLSAQDDGAYKVIGQYIFGGEHKTVNYARNDELFMVCHDDEYIYIKQVSASEDRIIKIESDGKVQIDKNATEQWVKDYFSESNFDQILDDNIEGIGEEKIEQLF